MCVCVAGVGWGTLTWTLKYVCGGALAWILTDVCVGGGTLIWTLTYVGGFACLDTLVCVCVRSPGHS